MPKEIPLTQGKVAIVDDEDYEWLTQWSWFANKSGGNRWYARRCTEVKGQKVTFLMHRVILNVPQGLQTDHVNRNTLDNRRCNLRLCTHSQNMVNRGLEPNSTSGYRGVMWTQKNHKWRASVVVNRKKHHIGYFPSAEEAALAYDQAARQLHGEFAVTNF